MTHRRFNPSITEVVPPWGKNAIAILKDEFTKGELDPFRLSICEAIIRFYSRIRKDGDCWRWEGLKEDIYGRIGDAKSGFNFAAHNFSYQIHVGPIPPGLHVLHTCDHKWCVNPAHLFLGTQKDNSQDMARKGLVWVQKRPDHRWKIQGENSGKAKLSEAQVREILGSGEISAKELANRYGVSAWTISSIRNGQRWRWLKMGGDPTIVPLPDRFEDSRGYIQPILGVPRRSALLITSKQGSIRANHYHKRDDHYSYVISGKVDYYHRPVGEITAPAHVQVSAGQMFFTPPMVEHCMVFPEDTILLVLARIPRDQGNYEADTVRVDPIQLGTSK